MLGYGTQSLKAIDDIMVSITRGQLSGHGGFLPVLSSPSKREILKEPSVIVPGSLKTLQK